MADFTQGQNIGTATGSGISPAQGSGDGGGAATAIALDAAADMVSIFGRQRAVGQAQRAKAEADLQSGTLTGAYTEELAKISDQVQSGNMSSSEGKARTRALFSQYASTNAAYVPDLIKAHKDYVSTPGLGQVIDEGSEREQEARRLQQKAADAGYGHDPERYFAMERSAKELAHAQAQVNYEKALIEKAGAVDEAAVASQRRRLFEAEVEADSRMTDLMRTGKDALGSQLSNLTSTGAARVAEIEAITAESKNLIRTQLQYASEEKRNLAIAMIDEMRALHIKLADGSIDATVAENQLRGLEAQQTLTLATEEPSIHRLQVVQGLVGPDMAQAIVRENGKLFSGMTNFILTGHFASGEGAPTADFVADNARPDLMVPKPKGTPDADRHNQALDQNMAIINNNMSRFEAMTDDQKRMTSTTINGMLTNASAIPVLPGKVARYNYLADLLGNNGDYWVGNYSAHADHMQLVQEQVKSMGKELGLMVNKEFNQVSGMEVDFAGEGITFRIDGFDGSRPDPGYKRTFPGMTFEDRKAEYERRFPERAAGMDQELFRQAANLNGATKMLTNRYIRAVAHSQGHRDYGKVWEEIVKPQFFGGTAPGPVSNAVQEVDIADFDLNSIAGEF